MAPTIELIESITLSSSAANVTFSNIPQDYDDLLLVMSIRTARASPFTIEGIDIWFNSDTTSGNYTKRRLLGQGSSASSDTGGSLLAPTNGATSSTFSNNEVYVPNYAGASNKSYSVTSAAEHNSTTAYLAAGAELWSDTSAITSIQLVPAANNLVTGSSFELYGIKDADDGAEGYFGPAAQGGDEVYTTGDGYKVHVFKSSGTLTVTNPGEVEYLVVSGGGGGGSRIGGGGGAGGMLSGSILVPRQSYTVMVGAGGAGSVSSVNKGISGSNSFLGLLKDTDGGGGGGSSSDGKRDGDPGGSSGGSANGATGVGSAVSGQGNQGGVLLGEPSGGGGGGGKGSSGSPGGAFSSSGAIGGDGGSGQEWNGITYAGGGGGGARQDNDAVIKSGGNGGSGGGGNGGNSRNTVPAVSGSSNTGGGGGGGGYNGNDFSGASGGSGIVIIRYKI